MTAKRPGEDSIGGEFKKPRVEVSAVTEVIKIIEL